VRLKIAEPVIGSAPNWKLESRRRSIPWPLWIIKLDSLSRQDYLSAEARFNLRENPLMIYSLKSLSAVTTRRVDATGL
jgi:hypothetical protein